MAGSHARLPANMTTLGLIGSGRIGSTVAWLAVDAGFDVVLSNSRETGDSRGRLHSGGAEFVCTVQARAPEQRDALFRRGMPGSRHVTAITAHSISVEKLAVDLIKLTGFPASGRIDVEIRLTRRVRCRDPAHTPLRLGLHRGAGHDG